MTADCIRLFLSLQANVVISTGTLMHPKSKLDYDFDKLKSQFQGYGFLPEQILECGGQISQARHGYRIFATCKMPFRFEMNQVYDKLDMWSTRHVIVRCILL